MNLKAHFYSVRTWRGANLSSLCVLIPSSWPPGDMLTVTAPIFQIGPVRLREVDGLPKARGKWKREVQVCLTQSPVPT